MVMIRTDLFVAFFCLHWMGDILLLWQYCMSCFNSNEFKNQIARKQLRLAADMQKWLSNKLININVKFFSAKMTPFATVCNGSIL